MGNQSIIYGYIETLSCDYDYNSKVLQEYNFDEVYPFSDIFSYTQFEGYRASIISIGGSYKSLQEDWGEWQMKFEKLLGMLKASTAKIQLEDELCGFKFGYAYVNQHGTTIWSRWKTDQSNKEYEEIKIDLNPI